jgi:AbrB family looped-hinge helix DNA binding protein
MQTTRLSSKGQVVIPKEVRDAHGWGEGTEFTVEDSEDGIVLRPKPLFKPSTNEDVFGCLKYEGPPKTIEEMNAAINKELKRRWERKKGE